MSGLFGGGGSDPNEAAMDAQRDQLKRLDKLTLPELEEYLLQNPELVGLLEAEELGKSSMEEISLDPAMRDKQLQALASLQERADEGVTDTDKYAMEQLLGDVASQEQSRQKQIESQMAQQGMDSSGAALAAKLQSKQSSANDARQQAMQMAAQGQQNRQQALQALGQQAGQMESTDYGRQANLASARDTISRYNAQNRQNVNQMNLAARQQIENQRANTANQQAQVKNQINQQRFGNELSKATGQGSVANSMSNIAANTPAKPSAFQSALGGAASGAGVGAQIGGPVGAGYGAAIGAGAGVLGSMFQDGGVAYKDGGISEAQKHSDDETKQRAAFKKKYMKSIHDEIMGENKPVHAENGNIFQKNDDAYNRQANEYVNNKDLDAAQLEAQSPQPQSSGINAEGLAKSLTALNSLMGAKEQAKKPLNLGEFSMQAPQNVMTPVQTQQYDNPFAAENGGVANYECGGVHKEPQYASDGMGDIIDSGMESYADDRVDAKVNDGEAILNVPQQQRMMDLLRGKISLTELGNDDIVEGVPKDYRDDLHEKIENESESKDVKMEGLEKLIQLLGK